MMVMNSRQHNNLTQNLSSNTPYTLPLARTNAGSKAKANELNEASDYLNV